MAPTRGHQLFWASGPYSLFSALAGARCNDVIAFFEWCIRFWPTSLSLPNENFIEGILDRNVLHIMFLGLGEAFLHCSMITLTMKC